MRIDQKLPKVMNKRFNKDIGNIFNFGILTWSPLYLRLMWSGFNVLVSTNYERYQLFPVLHLLSIMGGVHAFSILD